MKELLAVSPEVWLGSSPIVISGAGVNTCNVPPRDSQDVSLRRGPHALYRAGGWDATRSRFASAYGSWWADSLFLATLGARIEKFENWLPDELLRQAWPAQCRGAAALCEDWNDMREMFKLELPAGEELQGLVGLAAPQARRSTISVSSRRTPLLPGGGEQVYFKRTPTLNSVNPLWVYPACLW